MNTACSAAAYEQGSLHGSMLQCDVTFSHTSSQEYIAVHLRIAYRHIRCTDKQAARNMKLGSRSATAYDMPGKPV
ncbi:hypothetical protein D3C81_1991390 [compost metagenome]